MALIRFPGIFNFSGTGKNNTRDRQKYTGPKNNTRDQKKYTGPGFIKQVPFGNTRDRQKYPGPMKYTGSEKNFSGTEEIFPLIEF